jgi:hypothetical protein
MLMGVIPWQKPFEQYIYTILNEGQECKTGPIRDYYYEVRGLMRRVKEDG